MPDESSSDPAGTGQGSKASVASNEHYNHTQAAGCTDETDGGQLSEQSKVLKVPADPIQANRETQSKREEEGCDQREQTLVRLRQLSMALVPHEPREMECSTDDDKPLLYQMIEAKAWDDTVQFLDSGHHQLPADNNKERRHSPAQQAMTWVVVSRSSSSDPENIQCRHLPLHQAILHGAPLGVIFRLVELFPDSVRRADQQGQLPIHLALKKCRLQKEDVINYLLMQYPESVHMPDLQGNTPVQMALHRRWSSRGQILDFFCTRAQWQGKDDESVLQLLKKAHQQDTKGTLAAKTRKSPVLRDVAALSRSSAEVSVRSTKSVPVSKSSKGSMPSVGTTVSGTPGEKGADPITPVGPVQPTESIVSSKGGNSRKPHASDRKGNPRSMWSWKSFAKSVISPPRRKKKRLTVSRKQRSSFTTVASEKSTAAEARSDMSAKLNKSSQESESSQADAAEESAPVRSIMKKAESSVASSQSKMSKESSKRRKVKSETSVSASTASRASVPSTVEKNSLSGEAHNQEPLQSSNLKTVSVAKSMPNSAARTATEPAVPTKSALSIADEQAKSTRPHTPEQQAKKATEKGTSLKVKSVAKSLSEPIAKSATEITTKSFRDEQVKLLSQHKGTTQSKNCLTKSVDSAESSADKEEASRKPEVMETALSLIYSFPKMGFAGETRDSAESKPIHADSDLTATRNTGSDPPPLVVISRESNDLGWNTTVAEASCFATGANAEATVVPYSMMTKDNSPASSEKMTEACPAPSKDSVANKGSREEGRDEGSKEKAKFAQIKWGSLIGRVSPSAKWSRLHKSKKSVHASATSAENSDMDVTKKRTMWKLKRGFYSNKNLHDAKAKKVLSVDPQPSNDARETAVVVGTAEEVSQTEGRESTTSVIGRPREQNAVIPEKHADSTANSNSAMAELVTHTHRESIDSTKPPPTEAYMVEYEKSTAIAAENSEIASHVEEFEVVESGWTQDESRVEISNSMKPTESYIELQQPEDATVGNPSRSSECPKQVVSADSHRPGEKDESKPGSAKGEEASWSVEDLAAQISANSATRTSADTPYDDNKAILWTCGKSTDPSSSLEETDSESSASPQQFLNLTDTGKSELSSFITPKKSNISTAELWPRMSMPQEVVSSLELDKSHSSSAHSQPEKQRFSFRFMSTMFASLLGFLSRMSCDPLVVSDVETLDSKQSYWNTSSSVSSKDTLSSSPI